VLCFLYGVAMLVPNRSNGGSIAVQLNKELHTQITLLAPLIT